MKAENKRDNDREICYSKVFFEEHNIPGYIRDISKSGIKVDIPLQFTPPEGECSMMIIPHEILGLPPFKTRCEIRWAKHSTIYHSLGVLIVSWASEKGKNDYNSLIDYYS